MTQQVAVDDTTLLEDVEPRLRDLFERGFQRGYILTSRLHELYDPVQDEPGWEDDIADLARDLGLEVVDDLTEDQRPAPRPLSASTDSVRQYLDGIGRTPLLTAEQEVDLSKRDHAGRVARRLLAEDDTGPADHGRRGRSGEVSRGEARSVVLRRVARDGQRSHEHMVRANLRLVVSIAKRYRGRGLGLLALIQEGNLGLIRAVEKFDYKRGYKFSTYATWWIRQALSRGAADKARTVRLPVHVHELVGKIRRVQLELLQQYGRDPTDEEIAATLDLDIDRLREIQRAASSIASLDKPVGEDGDTTMGALVPDEEAVNPEAAAAQALARTDVAKALSCLDERERGILMLRFGLSGGRVHTLEEIGDRYGVTRERIRQIEKKTLAKLRHPAQSDKLRGLAEIAAEIHGGF